MVDSLSNYVPNMSNGLLSSDRTLAGSCIYRKYVDECNEIWDKVKKRKEELQNTQNTQNSSDVQKSKTCKDGKDDGTIGIWEATKSIFAGAGKSVVNTVASIFKSPLALVGTAALVGACFAFPPLGIAVAALGGLMGAFNVGKGIYKACSAKTDDSKRAAFEEIGAGSLQVGLSCLGVKGGMKTLKVSNKSAKVLDIARNSNDKMKYSNMLKHPIETVKALWKDGSTDVVCKTKYTKRVLKASKLKRQLTNVKKEIEVANKNGAEKQIIRDLSKKQNKVNGEHSKACQDVKKAEADLDKAGIDFRFKNARTGKVATTEEGASKVKINNIVTKSILPLTQTFALKYDSASRLNN